MPLYLAGRIQQGSGFRAGATSKAPGVLLARQCAVVPRLNSFIALGNALVSDRGIASIMHVGVAGDVHLMSTCQMGLKYALIKIMHSQGPLQCPHFLPEATFANTKVSFKRIHRGLEDQVLWFDTRIRRECQCGSTLHRTEPLRKIGPACLHPLTKCLLLSCEVR